MIPPKFDENNVLATLHQKMPWADKIWVRNNEFFGLDIRVKKGNYEDMANIDVIENEAILNCICENMTHEFKDAIGQDVLDGNLIMPRNNIVIPKEQVVEVEVPKLSLGDYVIQKANSVCEKMTAPFKSKKRVKTTGSMLPSKRQPNKRTVNDEADKYYDVNGNEIKKGKWWKLWVK